MRPRSGATAGSPRDTCQRPHCTNSCAIFQTLVRFDNWNLKRSGSDLSFSPIRERLSAIAVHPDTGTDRSAVGALRMAGKVSRLPPDPPAQALPEGSRRPRPSAGPEQAPVFVEG